MSALIDKTMVVRPMRGCLARLAAGFSLLIVAACATPSPPPVTAPQATYTETGRASWYGAEHAGGKTASGAIFDPAKSTAAHRTLPLRTVARITNTENGRSVKVVINDRGPYVKGRILDLSARAAKQLGVGKNGVALVKIEVMAEDQAEADGIAAR
ncbi:MAG: septal ring lytic transglycosylase RlpA family protein [Rhodospirillales bacterium]|nr:septal ring lytic transglycosylase RlpA family protein [Rhodospirillales bacterium]